MTPKFAKAVDTVFLGVLDLLERIERNQSIMVSDERTRIQKKIDHAEAQLGATQDWHLAKYALVSWIDSMLIGAPWEGNNWWENNPLERTYFFDRNAYTQFYTKAREAAALPNKDALEVYYICVVMGFRGLYGDAQGTMLAEQMGLPPRLDDWARQTAASIQLGQGRPPIHERPKLGDGAPPLNGRSSLFGMAGFGIILFGLALGYLIIFVLDRVG